MTNNMTNTAGKVGQSLPMEQMLTQQDLAAMCQVNLRTVERWASLNWIPGKVKLPPGKLVRYKRQAILAWIEAGCPRPDPVAA